ncbi:MAG: phosphatidylinositol-specific phospholipase C/glycerophosphodiester phosphodiesterase family protein [Chitinophagaceae bacterium]
MTNERFASERCVLCALIALIFALPVFSQVVALPHAFAHNDYFHKRPLYDAIDNGFTHIEADVYLRRSKLVVSHKPPILRRKRATIEGLYLKPLFSYLSNTDKLAPTSLDTMVLMIDIKSNGRKAYSALNKILNKYKTILSTCVNGKVTIRNLTLVLTGHRPLKQLKEEESRYVFADADLRKIDTQETMPDMFTTASCKYSNLVKWKGKGEIPEDEKERLTALVSKAHLTGTKVRLWGAPDNEVVWSFLRNCGVDLINTDRLVALKEYFIKNAQSQEPVSTMPDSPASFW